MPETTALFTYALGVIHLILTVTKKFELGILKLISFNIHGLIELIVSLALMVVAFYLGNLEGDVARNFYLCFAIAVLLTWLITDYKNSLTTSVAAR